LPVIHLGAVATLKAVLGWRWRVTRKGHALALEVIVDLTVASRIPTTIISDACGFLSAMVIAQQMTDFVNQQRGVLLDTVSGQPVDVVVQAPVLIHGHAGNQIGLHRNEAEKRRGEIAALMGSPDARGLDGRRIALGLSI